MECLSTKLEIILDVGSTSLFWTKEKLIMSRSEDAPFNGKHCTLANPHSNAVVDLDGDCLAGNVHWFSAL
jgi:hypothetical protein